MNHLLQDEQILALRQKFEARGMPWQPAVDKAIKKATAGIKNPIAEELATQILSVLAAELERCLMEKGKNLVQKLWLRLKLKLTKQPH